MQGQVFVAEIHGLLVTALWYFPLLLSFPLYPGFFFFLVVGPLDQTQAGVYISMILTV